MGRASKIRRAGKKVKRRASLTTQVRAASALKRAGRVALPLAAISGGRKLLGSSAKLAFGIAKKHPILAAGAAAVGGVALLKRLKGAKATGFRRRRGKVPKAVKKWITRTTSRRKQEEKAMRKALRIAGVSRTSGARMRGTRGVITKGEALAALRK